MRNTLCLLCLFIPALLSAQTQERSAYLLDQFTTSIATGKQSAPMRAEFNYDCIKQEMHFIENGEIMKLEPISQVDTIFLGDHKMIPYGSHFLDVVHITPHYKLMADYKRKVVNRGKKGAMGLTTQGSVENIDVSKLAEGRQLQMTDIAVYECVDEISYVLEIGTNKKKFNNAKSLMKLFPEKKAQIEAYIKEHKVSFSDIRAVASLTDFCVR